MAKLKWTDDELFLGATKMAEVMRHVDGVYRYHLGPNDHISMSYERKDDARQDCERHVRDLLVKAGA